MEDLRRGLIGQARFQDGHVVLLNEGAFAALLAPAVAEWAARLAPHMAREANVMAAPGEDLYSQEVASMVAVAYGTWVVTPDRVREGDKVILVAGIATSKGGILGGMDAVLAGGGQVADCLVLAGLKCAGVPAVHGMTFSALPDGRLLEEATLEEVLGLAYPRIWFEHVVRGAAVVCLGFVGTAGLVWLWGP